MNQNISISTLNNSRCNLDDFKDYNLANKQQNFLMQNQNHTEEINAIKQVLMSYETKFSQMQQYIQYLEQQLIQLQNKSQINQAKTNIIEKPQKQGNWTQHEKEQFIEALCLTHKSNIKFISQHIQTKSSRQIISHSQKFFNKLNGILIEDLGSQKIVPKVSDIQNFSMFVSRLDYQQYFKIMEFAHRFRGKSIGQSCELIENAKQNCTCSGICKLCIVRNICDLYEKFSYISQFTNYQPYQICNYFLKVYQISENNIKFAIKFSSEHLNLPEGMFYMLLSDIINIFDPQSQIHLPYLRTCLKHEFIHPKDKNLYQTQSLQSIKEIPDVGSDTDMNQLSSLDFTLND